MDPSSAPPAAKAVSISTENPSILNLPESTNSERKSSRPSLHRRISSKRMVGRLPASPSLSPATLALDQNHEAGMRGRDKESDVSRDPSPQKKIDEGHSLITQVKEWIVAERKKQKDRKAAKRSQKLENGGRDGASDRPISPASSGEEMGLSLDALEALLASAKTSHESLRRHPAPLRRKSSRKLRPRSLLGYASDTDYASDGEPIVPSCEVTLNTVEDVGMDNFKKEILTLTHTLRCKGWRRVALDRYKEICVDRMSGALTNAVYMVSPPDIPPPSNVEDVAKNGSGASVVAPKIPAKLLLRIYGPQVSHLIDRSSELSVLRRLARKRIGPRLIGTFENGRFEQFFTAHTLTKDDIRMPDTSRHIAKRLKELHEGIELEEHERGKGAIAWCNWERWVPRARKVMSIVDEELLRKSGKTGASGDIFDGKLKGWEDWGFMCGTPWEVFEKAVEKYRQWLYDRYGGEEGLKKELVFAHNDTQYGNILRLQATGKSPLLLPSNEHKQFIVIDFEYANANHRGFEFANHFCEWMANYHDPETPHILHISKFPTPAEQRNFLRAYVEHHLGSAVPTNPPSTSGTPYNASPTLRPSSMPRTSIPLFMLDARVPAESYREEEAARQLKIEKEVETLMEEAKVWRAASHAMWCAWGVVQAKIKGKEEEMRRVLGEPEKEDVTVKETADIDGQSPDAEEMKDESEDFDYLGYAQQRALLFWGDMIELGCLSEEELANWARNSKRVVG